jgi:hypothetical protein
MVLDSKIKKAICEFIYIQPRSVDEVAKFIGHNWRTTERYIQKIAEEDGSVTTRTFREGTRGALKIVYWRNIEKINSSSFQESLLKKIEAANTKDDFDPFDIYQYVDDSKKYAFTEIFDDPHVSVKQNLIPFLMKAKSQLYVFSGNLSWITMTEKEKKISDVIENLVLKNIKVKILARVDFTSLNNIKKVLSINNKIGKELIEIRHCKQPLRGFIVDNKCSRFKEEKLVKDYKHGELHQNIRLFTEIYDEEWIEWLIKVFFHFFSNSIDANRRIEQLNRMHP